MRTTLDETIAILKNDVAAIPTETVYGLAASIESPRAIDKIFILKKRPRQNPLIIHLAKADDIFPYISEVPPHFEKIKDLWPGPLTLILKASSKVPEIVRAGLPTAAFRVPNHPLARKLIEKTGPLVIPSANLSGRPSATEPEHIEHDFGSDFPVLDGGKTQKGLESTILGFRDGQYHIFREGALPKEFFLPYLGYEPPFAKISSLPEAPGQFFRHYSPNAILHSEPHFEEVEAAVGFTERSYPVTTYYLGSLENPEEIAANLYSVLRKLDTDQIRHAFIDMDFPNYGLWKTIRERLLKALKK